LNSIYYAAASAVAFMTLLTTLKLTFTGRVTVGPERKNFILFHPLWLGPLVVMVPFIIGRYMKIDPKDPSAHLSPWPIDAFHAMQDKAGIWAGVLAGISTTTVDIWLFWTTATALLTFTQPMATAYPPIPKSMHKYFHLVNLLAGAYVVYKGLTAGGPAEIQVG
jgi:hypothetical protein